MRQKFGLASTKAASLPQKKPAHKDFCAPYSHLSSIYTGGAWMPIQSSMKFFQSPRTMLLIRISEVTLVQRIIFYVSSLLPLFITWNVKVKIAHKSPVAKEQTHATWIPNQTGSKTNESYIQLTDCPSKSNGKIYGVVGILYIYCIYDL